MNSSPAQAPSICPLPGTGIIRVAGTDAETFLHGQLSHTTKSLGFDRAPLTAWHSAAGRVKAVLRVLRLNDGWLLLTDEEIRATLISDLLRFVLRDDVSFRDDGDGWRTAALVGDVRNWLSQRDLDLGDEPGGRLDADGLIWLRIGPDLIHIIGSPDAFENLDAELSHGTKEVAALAEISLGIPRLTTALQDRFIPQMLNLDRLGAIDLSKGCYPGQEIIARTENLGAVKRRMLRFSANLSRLPKTGSAVLDESGETVGEVIRASEAADGVELLAVTRLDRHDHPLVSEADTSVELSRSPLPYDH